MIHYIYSYLYPKGCFQETFLKGDEIKSKNLKFAFWNYLTYQIQGYYLAIGTTLCHIETSCIVMDIKLGTAIYIFLVKNDK